MPLLLLIILLLPLTSIDAANQAREQLLAHELIKHVDKNEVVWLNDNTSDFLILKADYVSTNRRGGVILLHDIDAHPDWPEIISPLRNSLPEKGWPTLSIQLPLLSSEVEFTAANQQRIIDQAKPRIIAAVEHFTNMGIYNIVLLGHGLGATAMAHFLSGNLQQNHAIYIKAFIAIRFRIHQQLDPEYQPQKLLKLKTNFPILDIISSDESTFYQREARLRKTAAKQSLNPNYKQEQLSSANNNFYGMELLLTTRVNGWLKVNATGTEVELKK